MGRAHPDPSRGGAPMFSPPHTDCRGRPTSNKARGRGSAAQLSFQDQPGRRRTRRTRNIPPPETPLQRMRAARDCPRPALKRFRGYPLITPAARRSIAAHAVASASVAPRMSARRHFVPSAATLSRSPRRQRTTAPDRSMHLTPSM